eukprot:TRINITY_DN10815_c0_g1_i1.p2 TRINITY_DN10815_c0_g1~~TRINITY_DN10815_c0_g1_i1.p2  ORF type:complete len:227 (+),score=19.20 TRINITY_DN10815_c0_g1_i1:471-1151(+)
MGLNALGVEEHCSWAVPGTFTVPSAAFHDESEICTGGNEELHQTCPVAPDPEGLSWAEVALWMFVGYLVVPVLLAYVKDLMDSLLEPERRVEDSWLLPPPLGFVDTSGRARPYVPPPPPPPVRAAQPTYNWQAHALRAEDRVRELLFERQNEALLEAQITHRDWMIEALREALQQERDRHRATRCEFHQTNEHLDHTIRTANQLIQDMEGVSPARAHAVPNEMRLD